MKFLVDEGISPKIVRFIRESGYDATRPKELGLMGSSDSMLAKVALENDMIIITLDMMFAYKYYFTNRKNLGFILLRLENPITENVMNSLKSFFDSVNVKDIERKLSIVRETEFQTME